MSKDRVTQNHWGSGHNINAQTVNIGRQPFILTQQAIAATVAKIGDAKTVYVHTYGQMSEGQRFVSILSAAGNWYMSHDHTGMSNEPPPPGITVERRDVVAFVSYNPT